MATVIGISAFGYSSWSLSSKAIAERHRDPHPEWQAGDRLDRTDVFTRKQVHEHKSADSLWLTYRHGI